MCVVFCGEWGRISFGVGCETVAVVVCFLFLGGRGVSQLPGGRRGNDVSQLWGCVLLLSAFFFSGAGGESASGEWRRVSFQGCVLSSTGNGGESASGGAKGEWGRVSFRGCEGEMM